MVGLPTSINNQDRLLILFPVDLSAGQPDLDNSSTEPRPSGKYQFAVKANQHSHFECLTVRVVVLIELGVIGSKVTGL